MTIKSVLAGPGKPRKYAPVWEKIKREGECVIECSREDTLSIVNMVRKERTSDKNKPQGKTLSIDVTDKGVKFKLITDTSIRNL